MTEEKRLSLLSVKEYPFATDFRTEIGVDGKFTVTIYHSNIEGRYVIDRDNSSSKVPKDYLYLVNILLMRYGLVWTTPLTK